MSSMKPMPSRPAPSSVDQDAFIESGPSKDAYPWEGVSVRTDLGRPVNFALSEKLLLKLNYVAANPRKDGPKSKKDIVSQALELWLNKELTTRGIPSDRH